MRTSQELDHLRERAVALRRQGKSRRQIKEILGPMSNSTLDDALKGEPPPEWTRRPNAKDDLRDKARELRTQGLDYEEIAAALGVAKSSVSLWVRDLPRGYRGNDRSVRHPDTEAPQPEDREEERGRDLSRVSAHRRPSQRGSLPQDRRLGRCQHGE